MTRLDRVTAQPSLTSVSVEEEESPARYRCLNLAPPMSADEAWLATMPPLITRQHAS